MQQWNCVYGIALLSLNCQSGDVQYKFVSKRFSLMAGSAMDEMSHNVGAAEANGANSNT